MVIVQRHPGAAALRDAGEPEALAVALVRFLALEAPRQRQGLRRDPHQGDVLDGIMVELADVRQRIGVAAAVRGVVKHPVLDDVKTRRVGRDPARAGFAVVIGGQAGAVGARPCDGQQPRQHKIGVRQGFVAGGKADAGSGPGRCRAVLATGRALGRHLVVDRAQFAVVRPLPGFAGLTGRHVGALPGAFLLAPARHRLGQHRQQPANALLRGRVPELGHLRAQQRPHLAKFGRAGDHLALDFVRHGQPDRGICGGLPGRLVDVPRGTEDVDDGRLGIVHDLLDGGADLLARRLRVARRVEFAQRRALQAAGDLQRHLLAQHAGVVQDAGQLALRLLHEVVDLADDGGVQVPHQHVDQAIAQHGPRALAQLLAHQRQRGPQAHARRRHGRRRGQHADQVDAQAHPVDELARLAARERHHIAQRVHQRHDVAHHRQAARHHLDACQRHHAAAGALQPGIDLGGALADVLDGDRVQGGDCGLRLARLGCGGRVCHGFNAKA